MLSRFGRENDHPHKDAEFMAMRGGVVRPSDLVHFLMEFASNLFPNPISHKGFSRVRSAYIVRCHRFLKSLKLRRQ